MTTDSMPSSTVPSPSDVDALRHLAATVVAAATDPEGVRLAEYQLRQSVGDLLRAIDDLHDAAFKLRVPEAHDLAVRYARRAEDLIDELQHTAELLYARGSYLDAAAL